MGDTKLRRGQIAPRCGVEIAQVPFAMLDGIFTIDGILDVLGWRTLVSASALHDAVRLVQHLGIRYLWVDMLCSFWDPDDDGGGWMKNYLDTFKGAKVNIILPGHNFIEDPAKEFLIGEPEEVDTGRMEAVLEAIFRGENPPKKQELHAALFLDPFLTDPGALMDRLASPRKLFCMRNGDAIWACAHHCTHSRYDRLRVNPRECLLNPPPILTSPQLPPPASSLSPPALPPTRQLRKVQTGAPRSSPKIARRDSKGTMNGRPQDAKIRKSLAKSKSNLANTLHKEVLTRALSVPVADDSEFHSVFSSDPWLLRNTGVIHWPSFSTIIETLSRCHNMPCDENLVRFNQVAADIYGILEMAPAPWKWDSGIGHLPGI
ncbi:hypothetical protein PG994_008989 [Apiospora phragmitis]|uniref:Heterokaryon incompatibility domain-containing protein n=1 Tax=Apiospora phragmitis TaxID=2905665 RepID=A0ABR1UI14_9PEZI